MRNYSYAVGAAAASRQLNVKVAAPMPPPSALHSMMQELHNPALAGAVGGGALGALSADGGNQTQAALMGAGMGAVGAAGGHFAGKAFNKARIGQAEGAYTGALKSHLGQTEASVLKDPEMARMALGNKAEEFANSPRASALKDAVSAARAPNKNIQGGAMLGGVAGAGLGVANASKDQPPAALSNFEDPYGYSQGGQY